MTTSRGAASRAFSQKGGNAPNITPGYQAARENDMEILHSFLCCFERAGACRFGRLWPGEMPGNSCGKWQSIKVSQGKWGLGGGSTWSRLISSSRSPLLSLLQGGWDTAGLEAGDGERSGFE